ncbi:MAG: serine--tRNA ligase [Chloroflexota bacterium]
MLAIEVIREKPDWVKEQLLKLQDKAAIPRVDKIVELDIKRRELRTEIETVQSKRNSLNKLNGRLRGNKNLNEGQKATVAVSAAAAIKEGEYEKAITILEAQGEVAELESASKGAKEEFDTLIAALRELGNRMDAGFNQIKEVEAELEENMLWLPNMPHDSVPVGETDEENVAHPAQGQLPEFDFEPKPHWDLGPELGMIDFERGVKLSGTRFYIGVGWGARLQRALINFYLDTAISKGFTPLYVPHMVHEDALYGSGQFPKFRDVVYKDDGEGYYFLPTAEVAITNMHRDEIFNEDDLPLYYVAHTPCYRREKTSAGRDTRGIKRGHQFEKVEMFKFCTPETSYDELESLTVAAEELCEALGLPYRRLEIVTGDLGFSASKKYDVEVWAAGCQEWLEVSSCSNTEAFQARRAMIRYRPNGANSNEYVHTLNGSGLAVPRIMIAIMENYQQADGSVIIPEVLRPYLGGADMIPAPNNSQ